MSQLLAETQEQLKREGQNTQNLEVEVERLKQEVYSLNKAADERKEHISSIEEKHEHARESLEHFRQAAKEQREQENRRHESEVQQLNASKRQAEQSLSIRLNEITDLNRDNSRLFTEGSELKKQILVLESRLSGLDKEAHTALSDLKLSIHTTEQQCTEINRLNGLIESERDKTRVSELENATLKSELKTIKSLSEKSS